MKLSKLVEHIEYELVQGSLDTEVADIAYDSRKIKEFFFPPWYIIKIMFI